MAASSPLELTKPVGTVIKSRDLHGADAFYKKTANDTWIDLNNLVPHSSNDPIIKRALLHETPINDAERNNFFTNKALAYTQLKGLVGVASGGDSPRKTALFVDVESIIKKDKLNSALTMGISAAEGNLPGMGGYKVEGAELFFTHGVLNDPATGKPSLLAEAGLDRRIGKFSGLLGKAAKYTHDFLKRGGGLGTSASEESLAKLKLHQDYFLNLSNNFRTADDQSRKMGKAYDHKEFSNHLRDLQVLRAADKTNITAFGDDVGWMHLDDKHLIGIVGDKCAPTETFNKYAEATKNTAMWFAYNAQHDKSVLGTDVNINDVRGGHMLMLQEMFPESGLSFANGMGYMNPSTIKKLGLADKVTQDIFGNMNKGPGSMFLGGLNLESINSAMNYVHGQKRISQQHSGMSDNEMAIDTTRKVARTLKLVKDEQMGIFDPSYATAMSVSARTRFALWREIAADTMMKNDTYKLYGKVKSDYLDTIDRKTTLTTRERMIAKEVERNVGYTMNRSFGGVANAFGGTVSSALAGAFLSSGIKWTAAKAQQLFSGDKEKLEGMSHNSYSTMMRRIQLTDFGSTTRFENGVLPSAFRAVGHLFDSILNTPSSNTTMSMLGNINKGIKDIAAGKGLLKTLDQSISRLIVKPLYAGYVRNVVQPARLDTSMAARNILLENDSLINSYRASMKVGFFGSFGKQTTAQIKGGVAKNGGMRAIGKAALRSLGGIFLKSGHLTGTGWLAGIGIAGGLLLGLAHGKADPNINIDPYNPDKVRNDPRFKEQRTVRLRTLLNDARNANMDGMPDDSQMRMGNRRKLTDFGSAWAADATMIAEVFGGARNFMARMMEFDIPMALNSVMTRVGNNIKDTFYRMIKQANMPKSLAQAEYNTSGVSSFMGKQQQGTSLVKHVPDRVQTVGTEKPVSPMNTGNTKEVSTEYADGKIGQLEDKKNAAHKVQSEADAWTMRNKADTVAVVKGGQSRAKNVTGTTTPHKNDTSAKWEILDPKSKKPKLRKFADYDMPGMRIKTAADMPIAKPASKKTTIKTTRSVITSGDSGKATGKDARRSALSGMLPPKKNIKGFIGGEQVGIPSKTYTGRIAATAANKQRYTAITLKNQKYMDFNTNEGMHYTTDPMGTSKVNSMLSAKGGKRSKSINIHVTPIGATGKISRPIPRQLEYGSIGNRLQDMTDVSKSLAMKNANGPLSTGYAGANRDPRPGVKSSITAHPGLLDSQGLM